MRTEHLPSGLPAEAPEPLDPRRGLKQGNLPVQVPSNAEPAPEPLDPRRGLKRLIRSATASIARRAPELLDPRRGLKRSHRPWGPGRRLPEFRSYLIPVED